MTNQELLEKCYKLTLRYCIKNDKDPVDLLKEYTDNAPKKYSYLSKEVRGFLNLSDSKLIELTDDEIKQLSDICKRLSLDKQIKLRDTIDKVSNVFEISLLERTEPEFVKSLYRSMEMLTYQITRLYEKDLNSDTIDTINDITNMWIEFNNSIKKE